MSEVATEIDVERANAARTAAEAALLTDRDNTDAVASLSRADVRLRVAGAED